MSHTRESCDIGKYGNESQRYNQYQHRVESRDIFEYTAEQRSQTGEYHTFRTLHESYFTLDT